MDTCSQGEHVPFALFKIGGDANQQEAVALIEDQQNQPQMAGVSSAFNAASDSAMESNNLTYSESGFNPAGSLRYTMLGASSHLCGSVYNGM